MVNCRLKISDGLYNALHGFITWRATGTAVLESKLAQRLAGIAHKTILQIFLDEQKAYEYLDWERCLELLRGYRLGKNLARIRDDY